MAGYLFPAHEGLYSLKDSFKAVVSRSFKVPLYRAEKSLSHQGIYPALRKIYYVPEEIISVVLRELSIDRGHEKGHRVPVCKGVDAEVVLYFHH